MTRERDLFRAIVLSGAALTSSVGCSSEMMGADAGRDSGAMLPDSTVLPDATSQDSGTMIADATMASDASASGDAGMDDAGEDAFVAIL